MPERHGFIHEKIDIKILILFILQRLPQAVSLDLLAELTLCDEGISYFDFAECVAELADSEHIILEGSKYIITDKGRANGQITENSIPYSVRIKAEKNAAKARSELMRDAMVSASREMRRGGGYTVKLSMSDGIDEILAVELLAGSEAQAEALEQGFQKNAEKLYNKIISTLLEE